MLYIIYKPTYLRVAAAGDRLGFVTTVTEIGKVNTPETSSMASQRNRSASLAEYTDSVNWNKATIKVETIINHTHIYIYILTPTPINHQRTY